MFIFQANFFYILCFFPNDYSFSFPIYFRKLLSTRHAQICIIVPLCVLGIFRNCLHTHISNASNRLKLFTFSIQVSHNCLFELIEDILVVKETNIDVFLFDIYISVEPKDQTLHQFSSFLFRSQTVQRLGIFRIFEYTLYDELFEVTTLQTNSQPKMFTFIWGGIF